MAKTASLVTNFHGLTMSRIPGVLKDFFAGVFRYPILDYAPNSLPVPQAFYGSKTLVAQSLIDHFPKNDTLYWTKIPPISIPYRR